MFSNFLFVIDHWVHFLSMLLFFFFPSVVSNVRPCVLVFKYTFLKNFKVLIFGDCCHILFASWDLGGTFSGCFQTVYFDFFCCWPHHICWFFLPAICCIWRLLFARNLCTGGGHSAHHACTTQFGLEHLAWQAIARWLEMRHTGKNKNITNWITFSDFTPDFDTYLVHEIRFSKLKSYFDNRLELVHDSPLWKMTSYKCMKLLQAPNLKTIAPTKKVMYPEIRTYVD